MATSKDIIACAVKELGVVEKINNNVKYNTEYYGRIVSGSEYAWCAVFVWYVFKHASASELYYDGKKTALCQTLADWFKSKGQWHTVNPQPGDLVFFKFRVNNRYTDHVGIVEKVNSNGTIETIEGNTSTADQNNGGMVMRRTRKSNIVGYGRPKYASENVKQYLYKGVDVSAAQRTMDYKQLKANGVDFGIVKIIRKDLNPDEMFEKHYAGFTSAQIPLFAVYNYSYATTVEKAVNDAKIVIKTLAGRKVAVCLDIEDKTLKGLGSKLIDIINAYQEVIEAAGLPFLLYTGLSFYNSYIKPYSSTLKCKDLWIARYYKSYTPMAFNEDPDQAYKPVNDIVGWQYTSSGKIGGYNGNLDLDIIYRDIDAPLPVVSKDIITKVKTNGGNLNVRQSPKNGNVVGRLSNGSQITVIDIDHTTGWYKIASGFVSPDYVETNSVGIITTGALNIRKSDSTKGEIVGRYYKGEYVKILAQSSTGWYLTPKGWVSNNYVKR